MFKKIWSFFVSHLFPFIIIIFLVALHLFGGEEINITKIIETIIAVLLGEIIQNLPSIKGVLKQLETHLLPTVREKLDYRSSEIQKTVVSQSTEISDKIGHEADQLKNILSMFINDPDLAGILSREIVLNIHQTLEKPVDCVLNNDKDQNATFSNHEIARAALIKMLKGVKEQIEESDKWGLSVESLTPDPEKRDEGTTPKYCEFVIEQTEKAYVFLGVTLMPPAWWTDKSLGLPQILDAQKRRIVGLRAEGKFEEGLFTRIFVLREKLIDSFTNYPFEGKSQSEREQHVRDKLKTATGEDKKFLEFYANASSKEELDKLQIYILFLDTYVNQVVKSHKEAGVYVGFHLVSDAEYKNATDFVLLVDKEGYECVISSLGFEHTVKKNESHDWMDLKENLLKRYRGFLEGRLFYSPMGGPLVRGVEPITEIGKRAKCWYDHAEKLTWPKDSADKFLYYHKKLRKKNRDTL